MQKSKTTLGNAYEIYAESIESMQSPKMSQAFLVINLGNWELPD